MVIIMKYGPHDFDDYCRRVMAKGGDMKSWECVVCNRFDHRHHVFVIIIAVFLIITIITPAIIFLLTIPTVQGELVAGLDWSDDGIHLAASTTDLEVHLWETNLCRPKPPAAISTLTFSTSSATLSWRTLGAWASMMSPTACASSQVLSCAGGSLPKNSKWGA